MAATAGAGTEPQPLPAAPAPEDAEGFLQRLAPVPGGAVQVRYRMRGPGGSRGSLEVAMASGARRMERWTLTLPTPGAQSVELRGHTVMQPDFAWVGRDDEPGERHALPFAAIAEAYISGGPEDRAAWAREIDGWHAALSRARAEAPGEREEIAGISCLRMQMAGQSLCLWEETGLPVSYRGAAFELEAESVEVGAKLAPETFELPERAKGAKELPPPEGLGLRPDDFFAMLTRRDAKALTFVLTPGLRLPDPARIEGATAPRP